MTARKKEKMVVALLWEWHGEYEIAQCRGFEMKPYRHDGIHGLVKESDLEG